MRSAAPIAALLLAALLACATPPPEAEKVAPGTPPAPSGDARGPEGGCDPCVAMLDTPIASLPAACALPKDLPCAEVDRLRNCIYARLGYDFAEAPQWREVFEKEPWYRVDPAFRWNRVTRVQKANAQELWDRVERRRCSGG